MDADLRGATSGLLTLQNISLEKEANLLLPTDVCYGRLTVKKLSASEGFAPNQGLCPEPHRRHPPPDPRYRLTLDMSPNDLTQYRHFFQLTLSSHITKSILDRLLSTINNTS